VKNQWNKKKRRKHLRSSKMIRPCEKRAGVIARGKVIGEESDILTILKIMVKDIVDQGGTISLNMEDGRLCVKGEVSDQFPGGATEKEEPR